MDYKSVFENDVYELTCKFNALCDYLGVKVRHVDDYQVFKEKDGEAD